MNKWQRKGYFCVCVFWFYNPPVVKWLHHISGKWYVAWQQQQRPQISVYLAYAVFHNCHCQDWCTHHAMCDTLSSYLGQLNKNTTNALTVGCVVWFTTGIPYVCVQFQVLFTGGVHEAVCSHIKITEISVSNEKWGGNKQNKQVSCNFLSRCKCELVSVSRNSSYSEQPLTADWWVGGVGHCYLWV